MPATNYVRRKYYVDSEGQKAILLQAGYYWFCGTLVFASIVFLFRIVPPWLVSGAMDFRQAWFQLAPAAVSSAVFLPLVLYGAIRFSHRFVGPMVQFRCVLKQLGSGDPVPPITLRQNDFWQEIAAELNQVSARLREARSEDEPQSDAIPVEC